MSWLLNTLPSCFSFTVLYKDDWNVNKPKMWLLGCRPKLKHVQEKVKEDVKNMMSEQLHIPATSLRSYSSPHTSHYLTKPSFVASCSPFGPKVFPLNFHTVLEL